MHLKINRIIKLFIPGLILATFFFSCSKSDNNPSPNPTPTPTPTPTPVAPTLGAAGSPTVSVNYAVVSGNITNTGNATITAKGFCWSKNPNPTLANNFLVSTATGNTFTDTIKGLVYNTNYYVRAYATNSAGTNYGAEIQLRTQNTLYTIGQMYGGGKVFYIDSTGEHGFIYAPRYSYTHYIWAPYPQNSLLVGATSRNVGTGKSNTQKILAAWTHASNTAAKVCDDFVLNGYSDWFLPSVDELVLLKSTIGLLDMAGDLFWTSSEATQHNAYLVTINAISSFGTDPKDNSWAVIPVRQY